MYHKLQRIINITQGGLTEELEHESLRDNLIDLANYALMIIVEISENRGTIINKTDKNKKIVYVASKLRGGIEGNIEKAKEYTRYALDKGVIPITPHLFYTTVLDDTKEEERKLGMDIGLELLEICNEIWVFGEVSEGMVREIKLAGKLGKKILYKDV